MRIRGLLIAVMALGPLALPAAAQPSLPPLAPAAAPSAAAAWPHTFSKDGATVSVYQPQAEAWADRKKLTARAAIGIKPPGGGAPILGTIELSLATTVDPGAGVVHLSDPQLLATNFPALDTTRAAALEARLRAALPEMMQTHEVPLAAVLLSLDEVPAASVAVNNDPPTIFIADRPASLVVFDGEPVLAPVDRNAADKNGLSFAVNTNWDVFVDHGTWYLLAGSLWLSAPAATGPYGLVKRLPSAFNSLPHDPSFADARKHIPALAPGATQQTPTIFVSTKPAAIIVTAGAPKLVPVAGTDLQRVANTQSTLLFDAADNHYYLQLSGRWFAAAALAGPWTFASDKLPGDFALIPADGPDAPLLASVPGTAAAQEAVVRAQIPTTAALDRNTAKLTVAYAGEPKFVPIAGTKLEHAVNTNSIVLKIGDTYYACENGAWFVAHAPTGPWTLADSVPPEVKTIPPSDPLYNVTYVQVYGATPTTVTYGYTAGYVMGFVSAGVLVYGTGYYYPPVIVPGPVPIYFPYPYTYAGNIWYNPANGAWARGGTVYGPYGAASAGYYHNPTTGAWAGGAAVYGPYGGAGAWGYYNPTTGGYAHGSAVWGGGSGTATGSFYNPRTGVSGTTNQNFNPYGRWGSSTFTGPNQTVNTQSRGNANGAVGAFNSSSGAQGAGYHNRVTGSSGGVVQGAGGDVYAGRDGNVYKHTDTGWSKYGSGGWTPVQPNNGGRVYNGNGGSGSSLGAASNTPSHGTSRATSGGTSANQRAANRPATVDSGNYRQLQQDRLGRQAGQGWGSGASGGGGRTGKAGGRRYRR